MSISTKESISLGLAHEFIGMLTRNGVSRSMIADATQNRNGLGDKLVSLLRHPSATLVDSEAPLCVDEDQNQGDYPLCTPIEHVEDLPGGWSYFEEDLKTPLRVPNYNSLCRAVWRKANKDREEYTKPTIDDLLMCTESELKEERYVGEKTVQMLQGWLAYHNYPAIRLF